MNSNTTTYDKEVPSFLKAVGIKKADSKINDFVRGVFVVILIYMFVAVLFKNTEEQQMTIEDISDIVKPNTILYNAIRELDDDVQCRYIQSIKKAVNDKTPPLSRRLYKTLGIALGTGILSEYIVSGNLTKPVNIISKTLIFTTLNTFFA